MYYLQRSCILRFDGAARGNPGPAGAGAALFTENGILVSNICNNSIGFILCIFKM
jgi:ribonuclease HI